jgi:predicted MPP superfamily phosphohydrolase
MKTIVISDLHHRIGWVERFLSTNTYDQVVFLGDYFDNFNDTLMMCDATATWLKNSLKQKNRIHLMGNHDLPYYKRSHPQSMCPGWEEEKHININNILSSEDWSKIKFHVWVDGWLLSHAGFDNGHMKFNPEKSTTDIIDSTIDECYTHFISGMHHPLLNYGTRMGYNNIGGIMWVDFRGIYPVEGVNQIVGHTPLPYTAVKALKVRENKENEVKCHSCNEAISIERLKDFNSIIYNLDTYNKHYIVIEDGVVTINRNVLI